MLSLKQNCPRGKVLATFLLNVYEIQLIFSLIIKCDVTLYGNIVKFIFHESNGGTSYVLYIIFILNLIVGTLTFQQGTIKSKSKFYKKIIHTSMVKFIKMFPYICFIPLMILSLFSLKN